MENTLSRIQGDWIKIWKLKVPNKIKLFIRRCAHGFLPTRERLVMRGIQCPIHRRSGQKLDAGISGRILPEMHQILQIWYFSCWKIFLVRRRINLQQPCGEFGGK